MTWWFLSVAFLILCIIVIGFAVLNKQWLIEMKIGLKSCSSILRLIEVESGFYNYTHSFTTLDLSVISSVSDWFTFIIISYSIQLRFLLLEREFRVHLWFNWFSLFTECAMSLMDLDSCSNVSDWSVNELKNPSIVSDHRILHIRHKHSGYHLDWFQLTSSDIITLIEWMNDFNSFLFEIDENQCWSIESFAHWIRFQSNHQRSNMFNIMYKWTKWMGWFTVGIEWTRIASVWNNWIGYCQLSFDSIRKYQMVNRLIIQICQNYNPFNIKSNPFWWWNQFIHLNI